MSQKEEHSRRNPALTTNKAEPSTGIGVKSKEGRCKGTAVPQPVGLPGFLLLLCFPHKGTEAAEPAPAPSQRARVM